MATRRPATWLDLPPWLIVGTAVIAFALALTAAILVVVTQNPRANATQPAVDYGPVQTSAP